MRHVLMGLVVFLLLGCGNASKGEIITLDQVPASMMKVAQEKLPDVKFDHARKLPNGNYEVRGKNKQGKIREIEFNPSGEVVEIE